jgi:monoamine oxidase
MHVAIVGAGLAGLSAALELRARDHDVTVVEARERVGGRTLTETHMGVAVDGGGQYVGPGQHHVLDWARRYGLELWPAHAEGDWLLELPGALLCQHGEWPALPAAAGAELRAAVDALDAMCAQVPLHAPWAAASSASWDAMTAREWVIGNVRDAGAQTFLRLCMEVTLAADWHEASLLHMLFMFHSLGGGFASAIWRAQDLRIVGGTHALSLAAADELGDSVILEAPASGISDHGDHVEVHVQDRAPVIADRAVVAMAPPLAARLRYDPPLPGRRDQLCQRMPLGAALKAVSFYDRPFWRERGYNGLVLSARGPSGWVYDNCWADADPAMLVAFITGRAALDLGDMPADERRDAVLAGIARTLGSEAAQPLDYVEWTWIEEPWSRGCYATYAPPGAWTALGPALRAPIGRIHWAGSDTAGEWSGFMDGAIASGRRAAEEITARGPS